MEELIYDESGQLQTGSFMDYAMPKAADLQSGAIAPGAALANAIEDALADFGIVIRELPVTPARLFALLLAAKAFS